MGFPIQDVKIKTTSIRSNIPDFQCTAGSPHFTLQKRNHSSVSESATDVYACFIPSAEYGVVKVMRQKIWRFNLKKMHHHFQ